MTSPAEGSERKRGARMVAAEICNSLPGLGGDEEAREICILFARNALMDKPEVDATGAVTDPGRDYCVIGSGTTWDDLVACFQKPENVVRWWPTAYEYLPLAAAVAPRQPHLEKVFADALASYVRGRGATAEDPERDTTGLFAKYYREVFRDPLKGVNLGEATTDEAKARLLYGELEQAIAEGREIAVMLTVEEGGKEVQKPGKRKLQRLSMSMGAKGIETALNDYLSFLFTAVEGHLAEVKDKGAADAAKKALAAAREKKGAVKFDEAQFAVEMWNAVAPELEMYMALIGGQIDVKADEKKGINAQVGLSAELLKAKYKIGKGEKAEEIALKDSFIFAEGVDPRSIEELNAAVGAFLVEVRRQAVAAGVKLPDPDAPAPEQDSFAGSFIASEIAAGEAGTPFNTAARIKYGRTLKKGQQVGVQSTALYLYGGGVTRRVAEVPYRSVDVKDAGKDKQLMALDGLVWGKHQVHEKVKLFWEAGIVDPRFQNAQIASDRFTQRNVGIQNSGRGRATGLIGGVTVTADKDEERALQHDITGRLKVGLRSWNPMAAEDGEPDWIGDGGSVGGSVAWGVRRLSDEEITGGEKSKRTKETLKDQAYFESAGAEMAISRGTGPLSDNHLFLITGYTTAQLGSGFFTMSDAFLENTQVGTRVGLYGALGYGHELGGGEYGELKYTIKPGFNVGEVNARVGGEGTRIRVAGAEHVWPDGAPVAYSDASWDVQLRVDYAKKVLEGTTLNVYAIAAPGSSGWYRYPHTNMSGANMLWLLGAGLEW